VHAISKARRARLQAHEASMRKQEEGGLGEELKATAAVDMDIIESIPSVPTMEQLPYLDIEYVKT